MLSAGFLKVINDRYKAAARSRVAIMGRDESKLNRTAEACVKGYRSLELGGA